MTRIYDILEGITLKDLPKEDQKSLEKQKGAQFGIIYREYMIKLLKTKLKN